MSMGAFGENFPYTNFHDLNMDWIIKTIKEWAEQMGSIDQDVADQIAALNQRIDNIVIEAEQFILPSTDDDTDRTEDIQNFLNTKGYCFLGPGKFVIKNTINMPDETALKGMGAGTVLQLADDSTGDIAINVGTLCTVQDMQIVGNSTGLPYTAYAQGTRKGIALLGDYITFGQGTYSHNFAKLSNLTIKDFNHSGVWAYQNDGAASFLADNIDILRCHTGINIENFSEFHSFSNTRCRWCNIACVMQGGNNLFANCHFDVNIAGIRIDGSNTTIVNGDHSSFVNCSICHSDNNNGYALWAAGSVNGLLFSNCQIWYGILHMDSCSQIKFEHCLIAGTVELLNSNKCSFLNNQFRDPTVITITNCTSTIWENNMNAQGKLLNRLEDRGTLSDQNALVIHNAIINGFQLENVGCCTSTNNWVVDVYLPNYFDVSNIQFTLSRVVFLGMAELSQEDISRIAISYWPTMMRLTIPYTGTAGQTAVIYLNGTLSVGQ